ncbi:MAG: bifunctional phosphopantothenoylcysteine decarboxylase/phosphopantothenate--cysteine ligase CoaBC [Crocinitomicaceae bacterium]|nr:bifunctional phosphopantothenoylcysteine decarboxylase/phosphopantothenate--cysteine ligase CoaBC [Crocinitomicaceae bacterium]|tara:strand:+ start:2475 stop:3665 length:1191 start_codon:yes stop_codon:yes gene_type:complete
MLKGKNVLLAITGSIAAYKSAYIVREFIKKGANIKVVMSESSTDFITPITLSTLSKNPVIKDFVKDKNSGEWNNHVDLGIWADVMLVAPATAHTISKLSNGEADSFMLATYLSARCPVFVAPAMDLDMYKHASTKKNLLILKENGVSIIEPDSGELASGLEGKGRLKEPEDIVNHIYDYFLDKATLKKNKIIITAGPTHEMIDPVRYIGNNSSGKMGFALAEEAQKRGAEVVLITGPVGLETPYGVKRIDIISAEDMLKAIKKEYSQANVLVMSAAVADYQPITFSDKKLKKKNEEMSIELKKTPDILRTLAKLKKKQLVIGFALETNDEKNNAYQKMKNKNLDAIVLNSLNDKGAGFGYDTNKITLLTPNKELEFDLKSKMDVAADIMNFIEECI